MQRRAALWRRARIVVLALSTFALSGCTAPVFNPPINEVSATPPPEVFSSVFQSDANTIAAISFSGGGSRAAAFGYGVLQGLSRISGPSGNGSLLDQVHIVSGVSGGAVLAAYFGLKGPGEYVDFRQRFLELDAEQHLLTSLNPVNVLRVLRGGANESKRLTSWLDEHLFHDARFEDLWQSERHTFINASDIYNHVPFVFDRRTFAALCSDLAALPISQAVAASAALPLAFAPIVLEAFPDRCAFELRGPFAKAAASAQAPRNIQAYIRALRSYRDPARLRYVKLVDGALTDNFGLHGFIVGRLVGGGPTYPLTPERAIALRRLTFFLVDSGRSTDHEWALSPEGPVGLDLAHALTDTAVQSSVHDAVDLLRLTLRDWENDIKAWRCALDSDRLHELGVARERWDCRDIALGIHYFSFDDFDAAHRRRLEAVPTRFKLAAGDVDLLVASGADAVERRAEAIRKSLAPK